MVELLGLFLILLGAGWIFNPANPMQTPQEDKEQLTKSLQKAKIWGYETK